MINDNMKKKVILAGEYSLLEPLASYHLSDVARQENWDPKIVLATAPNYPELDTAIKEFNPDVLGVTLFTGNHINFYKYFERLKKDYPEMETVVGGAHPTFFPRDPHNNADYTVAGEGFDAFRQILRGEANKGLVLLRKMEDFSNSDRQRFYDESPEHKNNPIKNIVASVGCYFSCDYCYNSNKISETEGFTEEESSNIIKALGGKDRFFGQKLRPVDEVIAEAKYIIKIAPKTEMFFFEDDVFSGALKWLEEFKEKYREEVGLPFHANTRFEIVNPNKDKGRRRLELLVESGCTGLSMAIESGSETMAREVLGRRTKNNLFYDVLDILEKGGIKLRTYNMVALPYGATSKPTKMNLEGDLETLELNVRLREATGQPTIAWASTIAPYPGTQIANYCRNHGFYEGNDFMDLVGDETYRITSVLRHSKEWVGPELSPNSNKWLPSKEQKEYLAKVGALMDYFSAFAKMPDGHKEARRFLEKGDHSPKIILNLMEKHKVFDGIAKGDELYEKLSQIEDRGSFNKTMRSHIYDHELFSRNVSTGFGEHFASNTSYPANYSTKKEIQS